MRQGWCAALAVMVAARVGCLWHVDSDDQRMRTLHASLKMGLGAQHWHKRVNSRVPHARVTLRS